jgi:hypothetical protein
LLVGLGDLSPLEGPQLRVVPAHKLSRRHGDLLLSTPGE